MVILVVVKTINVFFTFHSKTLNVVSHLIVVCLYKNNSKKVCHHLNLKKKDLRKEIIAIEASDINCS